MKYNVSVNEKSKTVTVVLDGGYKGVAKCCEGDSFCLTTGIELALERAKVAKANAEKPKTAITKSGDVMELIKALEKALPENGIVVVGKGDKMNEKQKAYLRSILGDCGCCHCTDDDDDCEMYTEDELEEAKGEAYDEGYDVGYDEGSDAVADEAYEEGYASGYHAAVEEMKENLSAMND